MKDSGNGLYDVAARLAGIPAIVVGIGLLAAIFVPPEHTQGVFVCIGGTVIGVLGGLAIACGVALILLGERAL